MINNPFGKEHLVDEQLACFIDGTCSESDKAGIIKHLKSCVRCSEAYREAVLYKGLSMSGASDFETSEETIELTKQALDRSKEREIAQATRPARSFSISPTNFRLIAIAASIIIIVTLGISYHFTNRSEIPVLDRNHMVPIREAVELASMNGQLVIPGGERSIGTISDAYRSGYIRVNDSLGTALAYFAGEFQEDKISHGVVYWLLGGYIATGQVSAARDLASQAIKEFPADNDIMVFDAIVSYMEGDITASEGTFRQVLEREPDNPYASLNLAVLLSERGDESGALDLLERIVDEHGDSPFAARAKRIAEEIQGSSSTDF